MSPKSRWPLVVFALTLGFVFTGLASISVNAQPHLSSQAVQPVPTFGKSSSRIINQPAADPAPLGEPCGSGEQLPESVICLHGTISLIQPNGQHTPLDGVPITVTYLDQDITGMTFVHPGQLTPTYGIDISPLVPAFLRPVTLTAQVNGRLVDRQVTVFPNFNTHNQGYDIEVPAIGALDPAAVWGYVVNFSAGGPITNAVVTAQNGAKKIVVTTTDQISDELPIYTLSWNDLAQINATPGKVITVTASYSGDADQRVVLLGNDPVQINFVTGWKCDDSDPLPRTGGPGGLPRTGGPGGLPDMACFWGYAVVNGKPRDGVTVRLDISGTVREAETRLYPGELSPRYSIAVSLSEISNTFEVTVTGLYSGNMSVRTVPITLGPDLHQEMDVSLVMAQSVPNGPYVPEAVKVTFVPTFGPTNRHAFASSSAGLFRTGDGGDSWQPVDTTTWPDFDHSWPEVALAPGYGISNNVIFAGKHHILRSTDNGLTWQSFYTAPYSVSIQGFSIATNYSIGDGLVLAHTPNSGILRSVDGGETWEWSNSGFPSVVNTEIPAMLIMPDCSPVSCVVFARTTSYPPGYPLYRSDNGGQSWSPIFIPNWVDSRGTGLAVIPGNTISNSTIFVGGRGIQRSMDGGQTWQMLTVTQTLYYDEIVATSAANQEIVLATARDSTGTGGVVYSTDNGDTWSDMVWLGPSSASIGMAVAPQFNFNDGVIFLSTGGSAGVGIMRSVDGGHNWLAANEGLLGANVTSLDSAFFENTDQYLVIAGTPAGVWRSLDHGYSWEVSNSCHICGSYDISILPGSTMTKSIVVAGGSGGIYRSSDGGISFSKVYTTANNIVDFAVANVQPDTRTVIYAATTAGLIASVDAGISWYSVGSHPAVQLNGVAVSSAKQMSEAVIFTGASELGRFYRSLDGGSTWITSSLNISVPVGGSAVIGQIAILPGYTSEAGVVYLAVNVNMSGGGSDSYLYRSQDGGTTWQNVGGVLSGSMSTAMAVVPSDSMSRTEIWLGLYPSGGIYRSYDGGQSWSKATLTPPCLNPSAIILPSDFIRNHLAFIGCGNTGVFASYDTAFSDVGVGVSSSSRVRAGDLLTYVLQYANDGDLPAEDLQISLSLPASTTVISASTPPTITDVLMWSRNSLKPSQSDQITVTLLVSDSFPVNTELKAVAMINTRSREVNQLNNTAMALTTVVDSDHSDVRVNLIGPTLLVPNTTAEYRILADNVGGLDALTSTVAVVLPPGLNYQTASPPPASLSPLAWNLGTLPAQSPISSIVLSVGVASTLPPNTMVAVSASITTTSPDTDSINNTATVTTSTTLADAVTLILIAPERFAARYGASPVLSKLYLFARHPAVQGVILDVSTDAAVRAAYARWDSDSGNPAKANQVAAAIKALIDQYTIAYPNLRYLVVMGSDEIIPFYRITDQNGTSWHERGYSPYLPAGTVRAALSSDQLLTDDYYADRVPTIPASSFWYDNHPLYLPDFAIGRLVETPNEIGAVIDAFLANGGAIPLNPALVGGTYELTGDLVDAQCTDLQNDELLATCTQNAEAVKQAVLAQQLGSIWTSQHSNHFSLGALQATDVLNGARTYSQTLLFSIGCHAGLNTPSDSFSPDLAQALARRGATYVASSAYSYAVPDDIGYSEELAIEFTRQLLVTQTQEIGPALIRAKQAYFARRGWFDYTDEKALLPMTLYGLPMLRVTTPNALQPAGRLAGPMVSPTEIAQVDDRTVVTYTLDSLTFHSNTVPHGVYYDYAGQTIAQDRTPVQPAFDLAISSSLLAKTVRGAVLRGATYVDQSPFDPVIAQSWAVGEMQAAAPVEPPSLWNDWDRDWPYALTTFSGLTNTLSSLNLVLGAYHGQARLERLFTDLTLEILYSADADQSQPTLTYSRVYTSGNQLAIEVHAADDTGVAEVVAVLDDGQGQWRSLALASTGNLTWAAMIDQAVERYYVQVVDRAGNVTLSSWRNPERYVIYLPIIQRH